MAYQTNQRPQADGFVNITLEDANGKEHRFGAKGVPLLEDHPVQKQILEAARKSGAENGEFEIKLVGRVRLVTDEPADQIAFDLGTATES